MCGYNFDKFIQNNFNENIRYVFSVSPPKNKKKKNAKKCVVSANVCLFPPIYIFFCITFPPPFCQIQRILSSFWQLAFYIWYHRLPDPSHSMQIKLLHLNCPQQCHNFPIFPCKVQIPFVEGIFFISLAYIQKTGVRGPWSPDSAKKIDFPP